MATVPRTYQRKIAHGAIGSQAGMPQLPLEHAFSANLVCSRVLSTQGGSNNRGKTQYLKGNRNREKKALTFCVAKLFLIRHKLVILEVLNKLCWD